MIWDISLIYVFDSLATGEKENIADKIRHISPAQLQRVKTACLDFKKVPTQTQRYPPGLVTELFNLAPAEEISPQHCNDEFPPAASLRQQFCGQSAQWLHDGLAAPRQLHELPGFSCHGEKAPAATPTLALLLYQQQHLQLHLQRHEANHASSCGADGSLSRPRSPRGTETQNPPGDRWCTHRLVSHPWSPTEFSSTFTDHLQGVHRCFLIWVTSSGPRLVSVKQLVWTADWDFS